MIRSAAPILLGGFCTRPLIPSCGLFLIRQRCVTFRRRSADTPSGYWVGRNRPLFRALKRRRRLPAWPCPDECARKLYLCVCVLTGCLRPTVVASPRSRPFNAHNQLALAMKINTGKVAPIPSRYSPGLFATIQWMLTKTVSTLLLYSFCANRISCK